LVFFPMGGAKEAMQYAKGNSEWDNREKAKGTD
jgi:hypothetical protein